MSSVATGGAGVAHPGRRRPSTLTADGGAILPFSGELLGQPGEVVLMLGPARVPSWSIGGHG